ncbi:hypothetical protein PV325_005721 [Microctonus aethiopoides]|nr:hypothetical protein PV325_005721 [Microctonus aethiopoides]
MEDTAKQLLDLLSSLDGIKCKNDLIALETCIYNYTKFLPTLLITLKTYNKINKSSVDGFLYGKIVAGLLKLKDHDSLLHNETLENLIEKVFIVNGSTFEMLHELFEASMDGLKTMSDKTVDFIATMLEKMVKSDAIYSAIIDACGTKKINDIEQEEFSRNWRSFLQALVSLPNRIANKMKGKISDTFTLDIYTKIITYHIVRAISFLNDVSLQYSIKPELQPISTMISKTVLILGAHNFNDLIEILINWTLDGQKNIQNFIRNILSLIDGPSIEPIAVLLLKTINTPPNIDKVFQNLLEKNQWKHVLITKIPLLSYYNDDLLIVNLIFYLASQNNDERLLVELLIKLLDIWGDRSALNHTSLEQHEYITKLILLSVKKLKYTMKQSDKDTVQRLLFAGTSAHLESMQVEVRAIGMITGELIVEFLCDSNDAPKLSYEYDSMPAVGIQIVERLKTFIKNSDEKIIQSNANICNTSIGDEKALSNTGDEKVHQLGIECGILSRDDSIVNTKINNDDCSTTQNLEKNTLSDEDEPNDDNKEKNDSDDELDSDDDLVPYDMSNDTKITDKLRPIYLRDLKENLLNVDANNDPNIFSESLQVAEELILSQLPNDDSSLAIELLEIITTLKELSHVENFELLKFQTCVAIVTVYPKECAKYLCSRFHAEIGQHSIHDRMLFLNILAEASKRLSKTEIKLNLEQNDSNDRKIDKTKRPKPPISIFIDVTGGKKYETLYDEDFEVSTMSYDNEKSNWEEIVQRRIQKNTRIFAHESKRPHTTVNKFNDVVASFFYPLLYGLSQKSACLYKIPHSYSDEGNILLVNFLKTLSIIMVSAENCVIAPKIGLEILELAWTLRYHEQAKVRLCVIQNIASVIISLSKETFTTEIVELLLEFRTWLFDTSQDSIRGDPDSDCRNLGKNVVALIDLAINSTMKNT